VSHTLVVHHQRARTSLHTPATGAEGIFRLAGSEKRIKELKLQFDSPDRYGKGLVWDGFTVHDAANVFRRYLNDLPEPVVPLDLYEKFRDPLRGHTKAAVGDTEGTQLKDGFDEAKAIHQYQELIKVLPPLNRQLLLYILDLLAVFAAKADENRMTAQNLAAIFQPGLLSHPNHAMAPEEYRLNQCVLIFLIENQDHFLIGMQGTAADEQTKQDIEKGSVPTAPIPVPRRSTSGLHRSASAASAGAESVSRDGKIRRHRSTSSRHSRQSNGASTPGSPAALTPASGGLARSNTVPSKKSPHVPSGRFQRQELTAEDALPESPSPADVTVAPPPPTVKEEPADSAELSPAVSSTTPAAPANSLLMPGSSIAGRSQERLLEQSVETPSKDRGLQTLFQRSPPDADRRQPNKLRKKQIPKSANASAQSSTASLSHHGAVSPAFETSNPMEKPFHPEPAVPENTASADTPTPSEPTPRASQVPSASTLQASNLGSDSNSNSIDHNNNISSSSSNNNNNTTTTATTTIMNNNSNNALMPTTSHPVSLHSSFNEGSELDQVEQTISAPTSEQQQQQQQQQQAQQAEKREKRNSRWHMSRRKEETLGAAVPSGQSLGSNNHAEASSSTVGSRPRKSWTGDSSEAVAVLSDSEAGGKDEARGPLGWIKTKYREAKENAEQKRTKSPPGERGHAALPSRGKSLDLKRREEEKIGAAQGPDPKPSPGPEGVAPPSSPPPVATAQDQQPRAP
jgi:GTPase-activating protein SAC7